MPEVSCILGKSIQTNSGMQKHISNWWILPAVFWVQICPMPRAINSFLAAKDRRALSTLHSVPGKKIKLSMCQHPVKEQTQKCRWQQWFSSLTREGNLLETLPDLFKVLNALPAWESCTSYADCLKKTQTALTVLPRDEMKTTKAPFSESEDAGNAGKILALMRRQRCLKAGTEQQQKKMCAITRKFFLPNQDHSNEPGLHHDLWVPPEEYGFSMLMEFSHHSEMI